MGANLFHLQQRGVSKKLLIKFFMAIATLSFTVVLAPMGKAQQLPFDWSIFEADSKYDEITGERDAKGYLRLGDMVILAPGNPPIQWRADIRDKEYRRFGVEWRITGDVSTPDFEEYRKGFNNIMKVAIKKRFGEEFFEKAERRIDGEILKASQKTQRR